MGRLERADNRFRITLDVIYGGSGKVFGILDEPIQAAPAAYVFSNPRRMLRVEYNSPVRPGMVVRTPAGLVFMVGNHGPSEEHGGVFRSFRLFEATLQLPWKRRTFVIDPITQKEKEGPLTDMGLIWCNFEPDPKEAFDRQLRSNFETGRSITAAPVQANDVVGTYKVNRSDATLGLRLLYLG